MRAVSQLIGTVGSRVLPGRPKLPCGNIRPLEFEWDARKAALNLSKHGVDFAEAMTVFGGPFEATIPDPVHSRAELRFVSIGLSQAGRLPVVVYTEREGLIRIIGAQEFTPRERREYESQG